MSGNHSIFVLYVLSTVFLLFFVYRRRLSNLSRKMRADFDRLLDKKTQIAKGSCEKLLHGIEGSKAIADNALRGPAQTLDLQRALSEISSLLAKALES